MSARKPSRKPAPAPPEQLGLLDDSVPRVTLKSTKQEILDAYSRLIEKQEEKQTDEPKPKIEAEKKRREKTVESAKTITVQGIIDSIGKLKLEIGNEFNDLSEKLVTEVERLSGVQEAITIESDRLSELHDIEIAADTLSILLQRHAEAETDFDNRLEEKRREVQETVAKAHTELENWVVETKEAFDEEMEGRRSEWQREQALHDSQIKERNERVKKDRERDQEEYEYLLKLNRKRDEDTYQAKKDDLDKQLTLLKQTQEQEFAEREKAVADQENELNDLRSQVESFPKQMDKAAAEARFAAKKEAEKEAKTWHDLREKEVAGERELANLKIQTLTAQVKELEARITGLNVQIEASTTKVQDIAVKAIEGAEGRKALAALNEIALQQAKRPRET